MPTKETILKAKAGHEVSFATMVFYQKLISEIELLMALQYVKKRHGAELIYRAEMNGKKRPNVIKAAIIRLDDFDNKKIPKGA
jgi:hypothetical protein